ncbi:CocE/NonD family hydrolase [Novosphingobium pokkalii]|uniref:CocE/NonD family hydrolase n=1 Tax=Novosphingobium pokkalii TaxID=1770194 RepID=A0ABV7UXW2_9SPHN|nr:CocE/NonD family hydrolase [Novosphingobium pokkalii]GHC94363.1 glutaryl-7-ACA acylase [Novosphingobium pokkalii]
MRSILSLVTASFLTLALAAPALAQGAASAPVTPMTPDVIAHFDQVLPSADFIRREVMVPMRDGTKLYTVIVMKKGTKGGPILLSRTPYDAYGSTHRVASQRIVDILEAMDAEFAEDGYIRVYQDIRGMHRSEGTYIMNRPIAGPLNDTGIDESTDAYDTIDWLVKNVPESNGKVGVIGSSYLGFTTLMAEINPHPALKAAVPESPMVDGWMGDDWFHNGAFRVTSLSYATTQVVNKGDGGGEFALGKGDDYTRWLEAGSVGDFAAKLGIAQVPGVRKWLENPAYTRFWSEQAVDKWLAARPLTVPTMLEVGQWDQEDSYGAPAVYRALEPKDKANDMVSLVIGPWRHSGANHGGSSLGALDFTGDTAREWRVKYLKPFFDHWLKDAPDPHTPPVLTYATGINQWQESPRWPMGTNTPLYLGADGSAGFARPAAAGHDDYVSDPAHPVPFIPRPIDMDDGAQWKPWLVHDQRFVSGRPDVAEWQTAALDKPVHIMGAPEVDLYAATTGTDSDWVVKLIDVYPNDVPESADQGGRPSMAGYELPIGIEIFRGRYAKSFAQPAALKPGQVVHYHWALPNVNHVFLPGHKLKVQVQSTLFPLYDRNPQTFVPNIMFAKPADYRKATQSVWFGGDKASAVVLPVVAE